MNTNAIWQAIQGQYEDAVAIRRHMHRHPELSFKEFETTTFLKHILRDAGIELLDNPLETGVLARVKGKKSGGKRLFLKADIDALPLKEETGASYCSLNTGVMHACGHDMHTAILVSVLKLLKRHEDTFGGEVTAFFQPGEELLPGGARKLVDTGFFETHLPDMAMALHTLPEMDSGTIGYCPGNYMASGDEVYITIKGKGGHAGLPHTVADPVYAAAQVVGALQQVVSRNAPPGIPTVIAFGKISGGTTMNIIPNEVKLEGTFRTFNEHWRAKGRERIREIVDNTARAAGTKAHVNIVEGYPTVYNNPELTRRFAEQTGEIIGKLHIKEMDRRMTTDDFAVFSQLFPSVYFRLGTHNSAWPEKKSLHSTLFDIDERAMINGIATMFWNVIQFQEE